LILLDTHVLLWLDAANPRLGPNAIKAIDAAFHAGEVTVSSITFWEVGTLLRKGRIALDMELSVWRADFIEQGLLELPVTGGIAIEAAVLGDFAGDPADRLIAATAMHRGLTLITADKALLAGHLKTRVLDAGQ
jgi:PIN domain nuclease of toxin-antitoxin system